MPETRARLCRLEAADRADPSAPPPWARAPQRQQPRPVWRQPPPASPQAQQVSSQPAPWAWPQPRASPQVRPQGPRPMPRMELPPLWAQLPLSQAGSARSRACRPRPAASVAAALKPSSDQTSSVLSRVSVDNDRERGARRARREERAYREYVSDEQRGQPGCPAPEHVNGYAGQDTRPIPTRPFSRRRSSRRRG